MNLTQNHVNNLFNKCEPFIKSISNKYNYPNNIKHLLFLIIPSFLLKYGLEEENIVLECFANIPIIINPKENKVITAFYSALPQKKNDKYFLERFIVLNSYDSSSLLEHLDNIIHEFNHAVNSYKKSIICNNGNFTVRSGLSTATYNDNNLITKEHVSFEEIINTKQTEEIMNILLNLSNFEIDNYEISTALYSIKNELKNKKYKSSAYANLGFVTKELLNNKTFLHTIEHLRLNGEIKTIPDWFDNIVGIENSYFKLSNLLDEFQEIIYSIKNNKISFLKKNKLTKKAHDITDIIALFNKNCIYH